MNFYKLCYGLFLICELAVLYCNCQTATLAPVDPEVIEGNDITLVCTVSGTVGDVFWKLDANAITKFYIGTYVHNGACRIVSTSYVLDTTKYSHECNSTVYQVTVKNVQRSEHNNIYSCIPEGQTSMATLTIKVQVPVSSVSIMPTQSPRDVIENAVVPFTCQSSAARPDASVTWYMVESSVTAQINQNITSSTTGDDFSVTTSILTFIPSRQHNGVKIFCKATNAANTTPKQSSRITLNVLYKAADPVITEGNEYRVIERDTGQLSCYTDGGNPTPTLTWSCNNLSPTVSDTSNNGVITKTLTWTAVQGYDIKCSCTSQQTGFPNRVVNINVMIVYNASITSFVVDGFTENVVTINESDPVHFMCVVDSNPPAIISLKNSRGLLKYVTSHTLVYNKETATCIDADTYTCSARNEHDSEIEPIRFIQLLVNCRPRSTTVVTGNRTSEVNQNYSLIFNAIAYPVPTFTWWKLVVGSWTQLESNDDYTIQSSDLQTILTINRLKLEDFTAYKLVAENTIGIFEQNYNLNTTVIVRPGPPTDLGYRHDLTTTDSIHITWKPGHNGGLPQTFHIKYKESSTDTWSVFNINDTGDKIINYTITGLTEKTQYDIIIYASNRKGSSAESTVLKAFTKENEDNSTNNIAVVIGYFVGATSGCFILVLVSIYLVLRFCTKRAAGCNQADSSRNDGTLTEGPAVEANDDSDSISDVQEPNEISTGDAVYDNEESVSKYETLEMENRDVSNYSVLVDSTLDRTCREKIVYENMKLQ